MNRPQFKIIKKMIYAFDSFDITFNKNHRVFKEHGVMVYQIETPDFNYKEVVKIKDSNNNYSKQLFLSELKNIVDVENIPF